MVRAKLRCNWQNRTTKEVMKNRRKMGLGDASLVDPCTSRAATRLDMFPYLDMPAPGARRDLAVNGAKRNADRLCSFFFFLF